MATEASATLKPETARHTAGLCTYKEETVELADSEDPTPIGKGTRLVLVSEYYRTPAIVEKIAVRGEHTWAWVAICGNCGRKWVRLSGDYPSNVAKAEGGAA